MLIWTRSDVCMSCMPFTPIQLSTVTDEGQTFWGFALHQAMFGSCTGSTGADSLMSDGMLSLASMQEAEAAAGAGGLDWEDSAGVSGPLYDIVDVIFELGSRGFFRRQVGFEY